MRATFTLCLLLTFVSFTHAEVDKPWSCPKEHIYVKCGELYSNYDYYGKPELKYYDKHVEIYGPYEEEWLDKCGVGKIVRKWRIKYQYDWFWCTQTIHVQSYGSGSFGAHNINWPKNYDAQSCSGSYDPKDMPFGYKEPKVSGYDGCMQLGVTYDDKYFHVTGGSSQYGKIPCQKIHRTWEVVDWCSNKKWYHTQLIHVYDDKGPTITSCPEDVEIRGGECDGHKVFVEVAGASATDNCGSVDLFYKKTMIEDNTFSFQSDPYSDAFVKGENASGYFHPGKTEVTVKAVDICGNFEECYYFVDVNFEDKVPPTPVAISTLTANLMKIDDTTGMVEIDPKAFNSSSYDNCTAEENLKFALDKTIFTCDDIGTNEVKFIVEDEAGNTDTAHLQVIIQASHVQCPGGTVSGKVISNSNGVVRDVEIHLMDEEMVMTDAQGLYHFEDISAGQTLALRSYKNDDIRFQVNMLDYIYLQMHIEGIRPITNPESQIAADINNDGEIDRNDLDQLFNVIIGLDHEFENNESWKFYTSDFVFSDEMNALAVDLPKVYAMSIFPGGDLTVDFNAIKIGDISAIGNDLTSEETPIELQRKQLLSLELQPEVEKRLLTFGSPSASVKAPKVLESKVENMQTLQVAQNIPNPFSTETMITFVVPSPSDVIIKIVDVRGQLVYAEEMENVEGLQQLNIGDNTLVANGLYTVNIQTKEENAQLRMLKVQ